jgi:hypothetical protein
MVNISGLIESDKIENNNKKQTGLKACRGASSFIEQKSGIIPGLKKLTGKVIWKNGYFRKMR